MKPQNCGRFSLRGIAIRFPKKSLVKIPFRQKLCGEDTYTNDTNYFELHEFVGTIRMFDHPQKFLSRNRFLIRNLSFINPIRVIRANWCNSCASAAGRGKKNPY